MERLSDSRKGEWTVMHFLKFGQISYKDAQYIFFRLKLRALHRFSSTAAAVEELTAVQEGKLPKALKSFLNKEVVEKGKGKEILAVAETKLGQYMHGLNFRPKSH